MLVRWFLRVVVDVVIVVAVLVAMALSGLLCLWLLLPKA